MAKGFYVHKVYAVGGIIVAVAALSTIIALAVVYSQERSKNLQVPPTEGGTTVTPAPTPSNKPWDQYRLPKSLVPLSYRVKLWPRLKPDPVSNLYIFTGQSDVEFECVEDTDLILIHSNKLDYSSPGNRPHVSLIAVDTWAEIPFKTPWFQTTTQYMVLELNEKLVKGRQYRLHTNFTGELADDLGGFYRSEYKDNDGVTKVVATTQMQPTDARKAFPCFDEPAMKAHFNITLIHDHGTIALSNGKAIETKNVTIDGENLQQTVFEETPKMSTYLLAFIVSDFTFISNSTDQVEIRIFARRSAIEAGQGDYALSITGTILKFFEEYYKYPYPLPKSDQIALPDFNAGAMENWGLITYRETALLYHPTFSSNSNKERIATIIAHELAHMWFGNLVTLQWWNDLWLNEGFASYVEYLGADKAEPSWNVKDLIVLGDVHRVFAVDALTSSHPLTSKEDDIQRPAQISEVFDAISYSKGASVLRMLSDFLTEDIFTKGLQTYLNEFAFKTTVYTDLWNHLQKAADANGVDLPDSVKNIMNTWVLQMGFPVITIDTATGTVTQQHFLLDSNATVTRTSEFNYIWTVPIRWGKSGVVQNGITWLQDKAATIPGMTASGSDWILANLNVVGYYRVNYDPGNWDRLLNALSTNHSAIPVINRAQLVDDAFNLARAKIISTVLALRTTLYLNQERDYMPWESALDNLDFFYLMFDRSKVYGPMQDYLRKQVTGLFNYYKALTGNWADVPSGHLDQYNQVNAISLACRTGLEECLTLVTTWFNDWRTTGTNRIHANLRSTVYCQAIAAGGATEWDFAWSEFLKATMATEAEKLRAALACTKQPWLLNRYLEHTLNSSLIRKQDATSTIVYIAQNVIGQPLAWDFVRHRWAYIYNEYGGGSFSFSNLINGVTKRFSTEFELQQLKQFKEDNAAVGFGSGTLALDQSMERTRANIEWIKENQDQVLDWFKDNSKQDSAPSTVSL